MGKVTVVEMEALLQRYRGRYTTVVGFQPTGWAQQRSSKGFKPGRRSQGGTVVLYQVGADGWDARWHLHVCKQPWVVQDMG